MTGNHSTKFQNRKQFILISESIVWKNSEMSRCMAHFGNIFFSLSLSLPLVYLQRNKRQTTDHLPMTLTVCGCDNFIGHSLYLCAAHAPNTSCNANIENNNRRPQQQQQQQSHTTQQIDWLLAGFDKQLIDWEIYWDIHSRFESYFVRSIVRFTTLPIKMMQRKMANKKRTFESRSKIRIRQYFGLFVGKSGSKR